MTDAAAPSNTIQARPICDKEQSPGAARRICAALAPEIRRAYAGGMSLSAIATNLSSAAFKIVPEDVEVAIEWDDQMRFLNGRAAVGANITFGSAEISCVLDNTVAHMPLLGQALRRIQLLFDEREHIIKALQAKSNDLPSWLQGLLEKIGVIYSPTVPLLREKFNDYLSAIKLADNWVARAKYETLRSSCNNHDPTFFSEENLPGCLLLAYRDMFEDYKLGTSIACAEDVTVCFKSYSGVRHFSGKSDKDQLFFNFSRNGDFLYKNNYLSTDTDSIRFFQGLPLRGRAEIDELVLVDWASQTDYDQTLEEELVFIGSRSNFAHFIFDHLPNLYFIEKHPALENKRLVFGRLSGWQKECLQILGVRSNYVELEEPEKQGITRFSKLWLPTRMPMLFRINYIRERFQRLCSDTIGTRRLFLSRAKFDHAYNRIANEDEVLAIAMSRNFEVVYPEEMTITEKVQIFSQAAVVLSGAGSSEANFWAFANSSTVLVSLYPEFFFRNERNCDRSVMYTIGYHMPFLERIIFVPGIQDESSVRRLYEASEFQVIDCPAKYSIELLERALDEAETRYAAATNKKRAQAK